MTFLVLAGSWETVLRRRSGATVDLAIKRPAMAPPEGHGERWVVFGNCLVMTGISPRRLNEQLGDGSERVILNIASHEQSPIAYFDYLRHSNQYPDVIIANVSSWINGTNFEQESALVLQTDPLRLREAPAPAPTAPRGAKPPAQAFKQGGESNSGQFQREAETVLAHGASEEMKSVGHRYHLFDYSLFVGTLATSANLDNALYQLNMQSWFRVTGSETDGLGFVGLRVAYRDDWNVGLERMAERSLQRLRLSRLLTPRYWSLVTEAVNDFKAHGTRVVFVRMPEHPSIRAFNDRTYQMSEHLQALEELTGTPALDLSALGPAEGVHLFDAVHPDADAAEVITREVSLWLKSRHMASRHGGPP